MVNDALSNFLSQQRRSNTFTVEFDFTPRITAYLGYRYESRAITDNSTDVQLQTFYPTLPNRGACAGQPLMHGVCTVPVSTASANYLPINTNSLLAGVSARLTQSLRLHFDTQLDFADNACTRISPRHLQRYRLAVTYKPMDWFNVSGVVAIQENRNTAADIGNLQHDRTYGFTSQLAPHSERYGFDLTYDYNDILSLTNICYVATPAPTGALQGACATSYLAGISLYSSKSNYGSGSIFFRPIPRVTTWLGYSVTSAAGNTFNIDSLQPTGSLTYRYHLPFAAVNYALTKRVAFKSSWNYYDYHEYSDSGPTSPRNFRGNLYALSARYAF